MERKKGSPLRFPVRRAYGSSARLKSKTGLRIGGEEKKSSEGALRFSNLKVNQGGREGYSPIKSKRKVRGGAFRKSWRGGGS